MTVDKLYCMCSFLQFRFVEDKTKTFFEKLPPHRCRIPRARAPISTADGLEAALRRTLSALDLRGTALMLSGGIDSAILARLLPPGTRAYTLRCDAPGIRDEVPAARRYAGLCGLNHAVIHIAWEDYLRHTPALLRHMGQPLHPIAPQLYTAALRARGEGFHTLLFGEAADIVYGGHSILLAEDLAVDEFIFRHRFVNPAAALAGGYSIRGPYERHQTNGLADVYAFLNDIHLRQSLASYEGACSLAGVRFAAPYSHTALAAPPDLARIRRGDSKYLVGELFRKLYPGMPRPEKLPMQRGLSHWLREYPGPRRAEFLPVDSAVLRPDQRWYLYSLEQFLDFLDSL